MGLPIIAAKTNSGNTPKTRRLIEKASQTFKANTPVQVDTTDGGVKEWGATVGTDLIAGFSTEDAQNIASTGLSAPAPFAPYGGTGSALTYGSVPNQVNAKQFTRGGPVQDGRVSFIAAADDIVFEAMVGPAQTTVAQDVGKNYGLTKDTDGLWYVDRTKTAGNAVVTIVGLHPNDGPKTGGRVLFVVMASNASVIA